MWNNTAISESYEVHHDTSLQQTYALNKWDVHEDSV